jgi:hypothetical protein
MKSRGLRVSLSNDLREGLASKKESQIVLVNGRMRQNEFWRWAKLSLPSQA